MNNMMTQMLLQRLKSSNPQGYQMVNNMIQNGGNPMALLQQILGNKSSDQLNAFFGQAKSMGFGDDILRQVQNGIKSKD